MIDPKPIPKPKYFRFNPADYNTTFRIVKNVWYGDTTYLGTDEIMIEYYYDSDLTNLFYQIGVHKPTPEDAEPVYTAEQRRVQDIRFYAYLIGFCCIALMVMAAIVITIYRGIVGE